MKRFFYSVAYALQGLVLAFRSETNLKIHFFALALVCFFGFYFNISNSEWVSILLISSLVISLELVNSAIESLCDFVEPNQNEKIKKIKDIAASAVLFSSIIAALIGLIIFLPYLFTQG